jgi:uncharacterized membrane protein YbaN (DUF454 family)
MIRVLLVIAGTLCLALGAIGIVLPVLPTTPFLLLAAALYVRSSKRLYTWLISHRLFGPFIRRYRETRTISRRSKVISLVLMWAMISLSLLLFIESLYAALAVLVLGAAGTAVLLRIRTAK